jgi:hypothetical protein
MAVLVPVKKKVDEAVDEEILHRSSVGMENLIQVKSVMMV